MLTANQVKTVRAIIETTRNRIVNTQILLEEEAPPNWRLRDAVWNCTDMIGNLANLLKEIAEA